MIKQDLDDPRPQPNYRREPIAAPVITWTLIQITPLVLTSAHIALWARPAHANEDDAVVLMIAAQVVGSALLFPWLFRNLRSTAYVVLITAPFLQLAGVLAGTSLRGVVLTVVQLWMWLIILALWRVVLRSRSSQLIAVAVASGCTVGVAWIVYLRAEFASEQLPPLPRIILIALCASLASAIVALIIDRTFGATSYPPTLHAH